jgi:transposase
MRERSIFPIYWPPRSPDINPIEHVWKMIKEALHKRYPELWKLHLSEANLAYLSRCLEEVWNEIPQEKITNLIDSLPHRLRAVIAAKGWYTKY